MDKKTALEKIKKCLRLAKSSNEHEAAQALKQAQSLMKQYGVTDFDVETSEVIETGVNTTVNRALWQVALFEICGKAFGCRGYIAKKFNYDKSRNTAEYRFFGLSPKPELAGYAYGVLLRQLRAARRHYIATELKRMRSAKNKTYRADRFCEGWVMTVWHKIEAFAMSDEESEKLDLYIGQFGNGMTVEKVRKANVSRDIDALAHQDYVKGRVAGADAQLNHAMTGKESRPQIEAGQ